MPFAVPTSKYKRIPLTLTVIKLRGSTIQQLFLSAYNRDNIPHVFRVNMTRIPIG